MGQSSHSDESMEVDGDVLFQEEMGDVLLGLASGPALVFAQGWPSWSFAADALGYTDLVTCVEWQSNAARAEFQATSLGHSLAESSSVVASLDKLEPPFLFIQGDVSFLESTLAVLGDAPIRGICASIRNLDGSFLSPTSVRHIDSLHWRTVSHKSMAGVTTGSWLFGSTVNLAHHGGLQLSKLRRSLKHVVKSTVRGGTPYSASAATQCSALPLLSRAPFGRRDFEVVAKSVFVPAGRDNRVIRPVTVQELMDIYDMEVLTQIELESFWEQTSASASRDFVLQTPVKALFGPALQVLRALSPSTASSTAPVSVPDVVLQSELDPPSSSSFGMEADTPPVVDTSQSAASGPSVKAAKNDDAEDLIRTKPNVASTSCGVVCSMPTNVACCAGFFVISIKYMMAGPESPFQSLILFYWMGGGKSSISASTSVSPWCLSNLAKKVPRRRSGHSKLPANDDLLRDLTQGIDCLERAGHSTFWEWKDGSSIFFWRWPSRYKRALRDGSKLFVNRKLLPHFTDPQRLPKDPVIREKLLNKIQVPRGKRYIAPGYVWSRTGYFDVPKGEGDIRIVYDATACGLNRALWTPNFYLPTIDALLRNADSNTFYGDIDLGEMFLNYALDETIRPYAGVDVSALEPDRIRKGMKAVIERWERTLMGLRSSPYVCTQIFSWSEEIIRGDRLKEGNPLRWDKVVLNLPGDAAYDPTKPRVYKWNSETGTIAGSFGTYVDDIRTQHQSEPLCRGVTRRVASGVGYLGQQDAPRKRRVPCQRPGAWSGAMCFSTQGEGLYVTCSEEKWQKGKRLIEELHRDIVVNGMEKIDRSRLEKNVGFLVHLSRTFPAIFPYLKGIYLTMESWRIGRDDEGWKFSRKAWWNLMAGALEDEEDADGNPLSFEQKRRMYLLEHQGNRPSKVKVVRRLARDLSCLLRLFDHEHPPKRLVRGNKIQEALYSFGDASGGGFGASWEKDGKLKYRAGTWGQDMEESSSNHRELRNLVESLEVMEKEGTLAGTEAFIFTDNSTAESAFYKGTSSSVKLFELVMRLRELEMRACCKVHLIHVSGRRMIAQGSDGLSRGNFTEGSMRGNSIVNYIPLAESALDRSKDLLGWFQDWTGEKDLEVLSPEDWFERGHDLVSGGDRNVEGHWIPAIKPGKFIWSPPPAAADVAVEELRKARHKRQDSFHIFVVPRIMKPYWHKQLCKAADIVLTVPVGHRIWPTNMHEPLTIGLCFPYLKYRPWELKRTKKLLDLGRAVHGVWKEDRGAERPILRELWRLPGKLERMSAIMARKMLRGVPDSELSHSSARKRRGTEMEEEEGRGPIPARKKR